MFLTTFIFALLAVEVGTLKVKKCRGVLFTVEVYVRVIKLTMQNQVNSGADPGYVKMGGRDSKGGGPGG